MAKSLSQLKKGRNEVYKSIQDDVKKQGKRDYSDSRFWEPSKNAEGSIFAEIRFLPPSSDSAEWGEETQSFVKILTHSFQGPTGKWYIQNSRASLGQDIEDPATAFSRIMWDRYNVEKTEESKKIATRHGTKKAFIANILVIKDGVVPENNGKVFLFKFGPALFKKIETAMAPPKESGRVGFNVFDPWDGANFYLEAHQKMVDGKMLPDYANSQFGAPTPLLGGDDDKINSIWEQQYPLNQFTNEKNSTFFKPYDELVKSVEYVMGAKIDQLLDPAFVISSRIANPMENLEKQEATLKNYLSNDDEDDIPSFAKEAMAAPKAATPAPDKPPVAATGTAAPTRAPTPPPVTVPDMDLQSLADLDGLEGL